MYRKDFNYQQKSFAICHFVIWCNFYSNFQFQPIARDSKNDLIFHFCSNTAENSLKYQLQHDLILFNHELADAVQYFEL